MSTDVQNSNMMVLAFDKSKLAAYFCIEPDKVSEIFDKIADAIINPGYHTMTEQLEVIDEEYTDPCENSYAKFCYGIRVGQIMSHKTTVYAEGGVQ